MEMFYTDNTLYVNIEEEINVYSINRIRNKLFRIIDLYNIPCVVLNVLTSKSDINLLDGLKYEYQEKYNANIVIK